MLEAEGLMTRDPRMVERKKPGQPKARKKFQFSKDNFIKRTNLRCLVSKVWRPIFNCYFISAD